MHSTDAVATVTSRTAAPEPRAAVNPTLADWRTPDATAPATIV
jgi:hypothetical protein